MKQELDPRLDLLNTLLMTPHRQLDQLWPLHEELVQKDPRFYVRLAAWYADHGDVRDHKELFIVSLILSDFPGHREVGLAMVRELPPYQLVRVADFINGKHKRVRVLADEQPALKLTKKQKQELQKLPPRKRKRRMADMERGTRVFKTAVQKVGLFRNLPRSLRTEVSRYLRERETDHEWFDSTVLVARKYMKRLYALLHVRPAKRAQKILFDRDPPADSRLMALRTLSQASSPEEQADAILKHKIPYRVAATVLKKVTPQTLEALIDRMSPQELINNLGTLKRNGVLKNPDLKTLVELKLEEAKLSKRVSALKTKEAIEAANLSGEVREKLEEVADVQVKAKGRITRPVALLVDKSSSMNISIDLGKRIAAMISTICESDLFVYAFDSMAFPIERAGDKLADWERSFQGIRPSGSTSCGVGVEMLRRKKERVEQIILISDEGENTAPLFVPTLQKYMQQVEPDVNVCIVRTPRSGTNLEAQCRQAGIPVETYAFNGDYYSLPNLVPLLARPSKMELLMEIIDYPLPVRKPA